MITKNEIFKLKLITKFKKELNKKSLKRLLTQKESNTQHLGSPQNSEGKEDNIRPSYSDNKKSKIKQKSLF